MGRVATMRYKHKLGYEVSYTASVTAEGIFTTTLPAEAVDFLDSCGVETGRNRMRRFGYFENKTLRGLEADVKEVFEEAFSRELVETKVILRYVIETSCHYCLDENGEVMPNGYWAKPDGDHSQGCLWRGGNKPSFPLDEGPYGFRVFVKPLIKETYKYRSGEMKSETVRVGNTEDGEGFLKADHYLRWLNDLVHMAAPRHANVQELNYTPEVGRFFVDLIKGVCNLNERIKDFVTPEAITQLAANGGNLLTGKKGGE